MRKKYKDYEDFVRLHRITFVSNSTEYIMKNL